MVRVIYRDSKGKLTTYLPNTMLTAEVFIGKKRVFSKRSYFEHDIRKEYKEIDKRMPMVEPFKEKGSHTFDLKSKDRLWEQIPEVALQRELRKATTDRVRVFIEGTFKGKKQKEKLKFSHEFLAPTKQLQVKGSKSYEKKLRANARRRLKQAIMDSIIMDITKSGYRMSGMRKIDKSQLPDDVKAMRKTFPLLRKVKVTLRYE